MGETMNPSKAMLASMALRYDHSFGLLDAGDPRRSGILTIMRQLWEEVAGEGFYNGQDTLRAQLAERDREIERLRAANEEIGRALGYPEGLAHTLSTLRKSLAAKDAELDLIHAELESTQLLLQAAIQRAEKAEAERLLYGSEQFAEGRKDGQSDAYATMERMAREGVAARAGSPLVLGPLPGPDPKLVREQGRTLAEKIRADRAESALAAAEGDDPFAAVLAEEAAAEAGPRPAWCGATKEYQAQKAEPVGSESSARLGPGDRVKVLASELPQYYKPGDFAVLRYKDDDGDWWGDVEGGVAFVCLTECNGKIERA